LQRPTLAQRVAHRVQGVQALARGPAVHAIALDQAHQHHLLGIIGPVSPVPPDKHAGNAVATDGGCKQVAERAALTKVASATRHPWQ
jgi:uncharacterized protein (DUF4213/DUF364 family)